MLRPFGVKFSSQLLAIAIVMVAATTASAQDGGGNNGNNFLFNVVGGVHINPDGVLSSTTDEFQRVAREEMKARFEKAPDALADKAEMRMVSLKGLQAALHEASESGEPLPEEVLFMAGIQRIQHVFLYPEQNDIVLAGPGEGWVFGADGSVVGETTGLPVIHLEDFLVAMRTSREASSGYGISCSIDPTPEGRQRLDNYLRGVRTFSPRAVDGIREALGEQQITLTGIPTDSRFARVLVAADYQMKRLAMDLEEAPINELPSFLDIMQSKRGRPSNMMPRWWLATDYEPLGRSEDGLAWELRGQGVKCMTEDEMITSTGEVKQTGRVNVFAQQWADSMNEKYMELAKAQPIFGDLRNIMDLAVVAALIDKERMLETVGLEAPAIFAKESQVQFGGWPAPKTVDTECSFIRSGREWIITASGGVQVDSWSVAENTVMDANVSVRREQADRGEQAGWYWN